MSEGETDIFGSSTTFDVASETISAMGFDRRFGETAQEMYLGYLAYHAIPQVLNHPAAEDLIGQIELDNVGPAIVPSGQISRSNGSDISYDLSHAFRKLRNKVEFQGVYDRAWLAGALLTLGDALADEKTRLGGSKNAPHLCTPVYEFLRHLRNGVAHGNRFNLVHEEPQSPAFFQGTTSDGSAALTYEITHHLQGSVVLFDFVNPGDICDLFMFLSWRHIRIANGDTPMDLWPQPTTP